jgi:HlyD family secretion protein
MEPGLDSLRIDKSRKPEPRASRWASRWILGGVLIFLLLGLVRFVLPLLGRKMEVATMRVIPSDPAGARVVLNATGYIVAHHKIQLASKVVGKVAWIGVEKGDKVRKGQVIVRLEDQEYRAQLDQAQGQIAALEARLQELLNGSRPEEIAAAKADLDAARADLENSRIKLERRTGLVRDGILAQQDLDDAKARFDADLNRVRSLERRYELIRLGPRQEVIEQVRGEIRRAKGSLDFYQTQLENTVIRAPIDGTILERVVEQGEFVTTGFVGDRGAKGFVVSLADLNDLRVELDISQNDFGKLKPRQKGVITTDAFPDRKYNGEIEEVAPEANRQKATVQVKVKVLNPDEYLKPEMNATVSFLEEGSPAGLAAGKPLIYVPLTSVRDGSVFLIENGRAVKREVRVAANTPQGLRLEDGLAGGEELILDPPAGLKPGDEVAAKKP